MSKVKIAMMGCFRSGTNFAKTILEQNYNCEVKNNVFGWKHGLLPIISADSNAQYHFDYEKAFFITKNPFSFLSSLFKYHLSVKRNLIAPNEFKQFIRTKIIVFDQGQANSPQLRFNNPIDFWTMMNWNYASKTDFVHIRYEWLVENPEVIIERAAGKMGLERISTNFITPQKEVKRINDAETTKSLEDYQTTVDFDKGRYLKHGYMTDFDSDDVRFVLSQLDDELLDKLGYVELVENLTA
ncbi:hypothetical protein SAMN05216361_4426 [Marisediminitalea aggregata]|uniref:Sulfotransferase family protein n=1 Tax=Marisediminitalea aggregata TaxID=634436 RepID=A0A1M5SI66_9ALTE|nr:hypothetical protein [Marisediminitalea aggregata]SHH37583.1 hypothetical protein SAMN05216361_4426 [Marisediminitalea aggregata]